MRRYALAVTLLALLAGCAPAPPVGAAPPEPVGATARPGTVGAAWRPGPIARWQWQLTGEVDLSVDAEVYELDAFTTTAADVDRLHAAGRRAICYLNVGAYEDFRPDAGRFPTPVLGRQNGWAGERWLDIRRWSVLEPVLTDRVEMCRRKGFDAVEADNVDGYANSTGFPLTADHQLVFNRRVAALARAQGLAVGLKNDFDQVVALEPDFDFAVSEECFRYAECQRLTPFVAAGKPVLEVEYDLTTDQFCPRAAALGFASMRKRPELTAWRDPC
ncbi:MAG TPA: endo alpha-1,4 polygalactosaminidase [Micromonosporaceae bacterium]